VEGSGRLGPLCDFLREQVPEEAFPNTNALDKVLERVVRSATKDVMSAIMRFGVFVVASTAVGAWYTFH